MSVEETSNSEAGGASAPAPGYGVREWITSCVLTKNSECGVVSFIQRMDRVSASSEHEAKGWAICEALNAHTGYQLSIAAAVEAHVGSEPPTNYEK